MIDNPLPASPFAGGGAFFNLAFPLSERKVTALKTHKKGLMQQLFPAVDEEAG